VFLELRLHRQLRRWITKTLSGPGEGAEIWTHVFELAERRIEINVDFFVPGVSADDASVVGEIYRSLYEQLYDEDERMMTERQAALDAREHRAATELSLGPLADVKRRLPMRFALGARHYSLIEHGGELLAYTTTCPHMLGPLERTPDVRGEVRCPWHAYRFDALSGRCLSGQKLRLASSPKISVTAAGDVVAALPAGRP
jgi:nitrite reductase/ring-hydroxylating ferredoxin subunit